MRFACRRKAVCLHMMACDTCTCDCVSCTSWQGRDDGFQHRQLVSLCCLSPLMPPCISLLSVLVVGEPEPVSLLQANCLRLTWGFVSVWVLLVSATCFCNVWLVEGVPSTFFGETLDGSPSGSGGSAAAASCPGCNKERLLTVCAR